MRIASVSVLLLAALCLAAQGTPPDFPWHKEAVVEAPAEHSSLAFDADGHPHVAYYLAGNLWHAWRDSGGWHGERVVTEDDVGRYCSLAFDSAGWPHISYYNATNGDLEHAWRDNNGWHTEIVDWLGDTGLYTSLAVDEDGWPHIAYTAAEQTPGQTQWVAQIGSYGDYPGGSSDIFNYFGALEGSIDDYPDAWDTVDPGYPDHAVALIFRGDQFGDNPTYPEGGLCWDIREPYEGFLKVWKVEVVTTDPGYTHNLLYDFDPFDGYPLPEGWVCKLDMDGEINGDNYTNLSLYEVDLNHREGELLDGLPQTGEPQTWYVVAGEEGVLPVGLSHAWQDETGWHSEYVDNEHLRCRHASLAFDADGWPHMAYYDAERTDLWHAWQDADGWSYELVDDLGDVGEYASLAFDEAGVPCISYYDRTNGDLKFAWQDGSWWQIETVDTQGDVGAFTSLVFGEDDFGRIAYRGQGCLKYAWEDAGGWNIETADSTGDSGQYASLALSPSGIPHVAYLDDAVDVLKHAWRDPCWPTEAPDPEPYCQGALFGRPKSGYPGWIWFSIPLDPDDCCDEGDCYDPNVLLGFACNGRLWCCDVYSKAPQVYRPPFLQWDLGVGAGYLLYLESDVDNPSFWGLIPESALELKLGREGWVWLGMPGLEELGYIDFMNSVRVQYPVGGQIRTAGEDYGWTPHNWVQWGWSFWDTYGQAPRAFTPYLPFGCNICYPWVGYRLYVNVGTARSPDNPDQVTLIWPYPGG